MKIILKYHPKRLQADLRLAIMLLLAGLICLIINGLWPVISFALISLGLGLITAGFIALAIYLYEWRTQYLTVEDNFIYKNRLFTNRLNLEDVMDVSYFSDECVIRTEDSYLRIKRAYISDQSWLRLNELLKEKGVIEYQPEDIE